MSIFGEYGNFTTDLFRNHLNIARRKIQWVSKSTIHWYSRIFSTSVCFISTNVTNKKKLLIYILRNITKSFKLFKIMVVNCALDKSKVLISKQNLVKVEDTDSDETRLRFPTQ